MTIMHIRTSNQSTATKAVSEIQKAISEFNEQSCIQFKVDQDCDTDLFPPRCLQILELDSEASNDR